MTYKNNIEAVAQLQPDYLGFIFYEKSARNYKNNSIPELSKNIKKVGVFVNENFETVVKKVQQFNLQAVQLHGNESPEYCLQLKEEFRAELNETVFEIIKVFNIKDKFDFSVLEPYEAICDYFLFDTKGKLPGGNGFTFNWNVLKNYPSTKPYFLSGGIGLNEIDKIKEFKKSTASKYCYAIDVNSKFEIEPGLKNIEDLEKFRFKINT